MNRAFTFIESLVAVATAAILALLVFGGYQTYQASSVTQGEIVEKQYVESWVEMQTQSNGNGGTITIPITHPEEWVLVIQGLNKKGEIRDRHLRVHAAAYDRHRVGEQVSTTDL